MIGLGRLQKVDALLSILACACCPACTNFALTPLQVIIIALVREQEGPQRCNHSCISCWQVIADTTGAYRVLETSHPPTYYIPPKDVDMQQLKPSSGSSYCEWKGSASYYDAPGKPKIAWYYAKPTSSFTPIANYLCFYPSKVDKATVGEETVTAQPGESLVLSIDDSDFPLYIS